MDMSEMSSLLFSISSSRSSNGPSNCSSSTLYIVYIQLLIWYNIKTYGYNQPCQKFYADHWRYSDAVSFFILGLIDQIPGSTRAICLATSLLAVFGRLRDLDRGVLHRRPLQPPNRQKRLRLLHRRSQDNRLHGRSHHIYFLCQSVIRSGAQNHSFPDGSGIFGIIPALAPELQRAHQIRVFP